MTEADRPEEPDAAPQARGQVESPRRVMSAARWTWEWLKSLAIAFVLFLLIRTFAVEAFRIPTASMERTLLVGDFLLVNKAVYGAQVPGTAMRLPAFGHPAHGDVMVFTPPHEPRKNYVKRLVGLPGDTLRMRDKVLFRNGHVVPEPYAQHGDPLDVFDPRMRWQLDYLVMGSDRMDYRPTRDNWGPLVVPEGRYFVLGDNRDDSEDSRYWGLVDEETLKGKPIVVYYSFETTSLSQIPWITDIRWDRIGGPIE